MYVRSPLSDRKQLRVLEHFVVGGAARVAAEIVGVEANTAIRFDMWMSELIASQLRNYELRGKVEADERLFQGRPKVQAKRHLRRANGIKSESFL